MRVNSDPTASQTLGNPSTVSPIDYFTVYKNKLLSWQPSKTTFLMIIGAVVVLIVERKLNIKAKKYNFNFGGKK